MLEAILSGDPLAVPEEPATAGRRRVGARPAAERLPAQSDLAIGGGSDDALAEEELQLVTGKEEGVESGEYPSEPEREWEEEEAMGLTWVPRIEGLGKRVNRLGQILREKKMKAEGRRKVGANPL